MRRSVNVLTDVGASEVVSIVTFIDINARHPIVGELESLT